MNPPIMIGGTPKSTASKEYIMNSSIHRACRNAILFVSVAFLAMGATVLQAKTIKKQSIVELMAHTDSILIGTVSDKTDGFQDGLPYTEIKLSVAQNIKGDHGESYTFRQFGLIEPKATGDGRVNLMVTPAGWPKYAKGEQVMLFLHKPASNTGFQTTAGLTQGKFTISGTEIVNGSNNDSLFSGVLINGNLNPGQKDLMAQAGGSYEVVDFVSLIKAAVDGQWIEKGVMIDEN